MTIRMHAKRAYSPSPSVFNPLQVISPAGEITCKKEKVPCWRRLDLPLAEALNMHEEVKPPLSTIWSIIINWKCAEETCACLESLTPTVDPDTVVVIDNGSADGSVETIR